MTIALALGSLAALMLGWTLGRVLSVAFRQRTPRLRVVGHAGKRVPDVAVKRAVSEPAATRIPRRQVR
jgi:hypothetical protein